MIAIINFILAPLWSLHSPPSVLFCEVPWKPREGLLALSGKGLGNVRPSWAPLLQPGFAQAEQDTDNWGQGAGWLELGHGVWALGGEQGRWEQLLFPSPERTQRYLVHSVRALVTKACCDHSRLQHDSVPSLTAPPSDVVLMLSWGWQRGDQTLCERQSCPSTVIFLAHLRGCLIVMGELSKSRTHSAWCAAKGGA